MVYFCNERIWYKEKCNNKLQIARSCLEYKLFSSKQKGQWHLADLLIILYHIWFNRTLKACQSQCSSVALLTHSSLTHVFKCQGCGKVTLHMSRTLLPSAIHRAALGKNICRMLLTSSLLPDTLPRFSFCSAHCIKRQMETPATHLMLRNLLLSHCFSCLVRSSS